MSVIVCQNVTKTFERHTGQKLLRQHISGFVKRARMERFFALKDVSFAVEKGASLAVIGSNGAGKSTLLNLITGLGPPDSGSIRVQGRTAALLELGSGFHPDLTGAENVRLNAALLGFHRRKFSKLFDKIVEFSDIGDFIEEPLRTYSSGMVVRLAFSVAINVDPDVLIIDEVLAVGDQDFQAKCHERIMELRRGGATFLCVSHAANMLLELCNEGLWLDHGEVKRQGPIEDVLDAYQNHAVGVAAG